MDEMTGVSGSGSPVCPHGQLARVCRVCELEQEVALLSNAAQLQKLVVNAAYEDKCRAERERDAAIVARDRNITTRFIVDRLQKQNATLRSALAQVEWVDSGPGDGLSAILGDCYEYCPWCGQNKNYGHAPDCARQAALGVGGEQ